jgi:acyl-CoA synthetase (AMP-forming)/AMP-acid ligase II
MAEIIPGAIAIVEPLKQRWSTRRGYRLTTFQELDQSSDEIARGLLASGVEPSMRLAMLVQFSGQFITLVLAILKTGAAIVLVDPGIGRQHLIACLSASNPDGIIGIPRAQVARLLLRHRFSNSIHNVTTGRLAFPGCHTLAQVQSLGRRSQTTEFPEIRDADPAAVIFTTGSTGPPKGVLYTHGTFHSQIDRIQSRYGIERGQRDLACFPLFGLFDAVMGVTTVIPDMDPTRPANVDPMKLIKTASDWQVDQAFGSPALWNRVVRYCRTHQIHAPFPTLRRVLSAGAPVPTATLQGMRDLLDPEIQIVTPYGATEALPIASIESREILIQTQFATAKGKGVCVGTRFADVQWRVIEITDGPLETLEQTVSLPPQKIGELLVSGPMVTTRYVVRDDQNGLHKVMDGNRVWHRMGDVGYLDAEDRFWFCGRKSHRVVMSDRTLFTIPCEAIFNQHPLVFRSALVGRGHAPSQTPVILVELEPEALSISEQERTRLHNELMDLAKQHPITQRIEEIIIRDKPLPVDIRHNSKIFRERLAAEVNSG